jgi:hypothetical protein
VLFSVAAILLAGSSAVNARDLLSPTNLNHPTPRLTEAAWTVPLTQPTFTTSYGQSSKICSISGLGHTSYCVVRSWQQRVAVQPSLLTAVD